VPAFRQPPAAFSAALSALNPAAYKIKGMPHNPGTAPVGTLQRGMVSPRLPVPSGIARPEYVGRKAPAPFTGSEVKTAETIEKIRKAGRLAAQAVEEVGRSAQPGVTTDALDRIGHEFLVDHGAYSSINEVICHGIPDSTVLQDGDILNIDITAYLDGVHGDTNSTFLVGDVDEESRLLVERTKEALNRAIRAVAPGREINVIGRAIESYARRFGYGVVRDFTGHGVGEAFHTGLIIPHYDAAPAYNRVIETGMVFTIEPMLTLGTIDWDMWADDWTVVTRDAKRTAQFEHTLVVTDTGAEILTLP
jgi:methionyl aminopeptidase